MSNKVSLDDNASASPEPVTLRGLLQSWLDEAEQVENAPKREKECGGLCPS